MINWYFSSFLKRIIFLKKNMFLIILQWACL